MVKAKMLLVLGLALLARSDDVKLPGPGHECELQVIVGDPDWTQHTASDPDILVKVPCVDRDEVRDLLVGFFTDQLANDPAAKKFRSAIDHAGDLTLTITSRRNK